jgi:hypothetical protein
VPYAQNLGRVIARLRPDPELPFGSYAALCDVIARSGFFACAS